MVGPTSLSAVALLDCLRVLLLDSALPGSILFSEYSQVGVEHHVPISGRAFLAMVPPVQLYAEQQTQNCRSSRAKCRSRNRSVICFKQSQGQVTDCSTVASEDLEAGEDIFTFDRKDILCIENTELRSLSTQRSEEPNPWNDLILAIIYEDLKGDSSKWAPYLALLPDVQGSNQLNTLMFWSEHELQELQASSVRDKIGRTSADEKFRNSVIPAIRRSDSPFSSLPALQHCSDDDLLGKAHRAGSLIMAYAFDLEPETASQRPDEDGYVSDEDESMLAKGMIPMADLLNADADRNNARLYYDPDCVTMKTLTAVKAGEQLFNDYGPLPRSDLLRRYGYITDNYTQYDVVEIPYTLVLEVAQASQAHLDAKIEWMQEHDLFDDAFDISWPLEDESLFPWQLRALLFVTTTDDKAAFGRLLKSNAVEQSLPYPLEPVWAYQTFHKILQARLAQYTTSAAHDRQILNDLAVNDKSRTKIAVQVRLGEKELLQTAANKIEQLLMAQSANGNGHGIKRSMTQDDSSRKRTR